MLGGGEVEPFPSLKFSFDGSFLVLHLASFSPTKNITPKISNEQFSFFDVGCGAYPFGEPHGWLLPMTFIKIAAS